LGEKEKSAEKSTLPVKLIIRRKGFKISTEGTIASLYNEIDSLADFTDKITEKLGVLEESPIEEAEAEVPVSREEVEKIPTTDIPAIKSTKSTTENLVLLFDTPWGRTPRTLAEIMKALEVNAVLDRVSSVNVYLRRLVQKGSLRRLEKEGKYVYFKLPE
jgi:hypothetical protein